MAPSSLPIREGVRFIRKPASADDLRDAVANALTPFNLGPQIDLAGLGFDRAGQRLLRDGGSEQLTPIEFRLLDHLATRRGSIARTEDLLEDVWHYTKGTASSDVVRSHMKNLRAKIRRVNDGQDIIETIPRRGYRLCASRVDKSAFQNASPQCPHFDTAHRRRTKFPPLGENSFKKKHPQTNFRNTGGKQGCIACQNKRTASPPRTPYLESARSTRYQS